MDLATIVAEVLKFVYTVVTLFAGDTEAPDVIAALQKLVDAVTSKAE